MVESTEAPKNLVGFFDYYFVKKAPFQIPQAGREFIVQIAPWVVVVLLLLAVPAILFLLGVGAVWTPFTVGGYRYGYSDSFGWGYAYGYWPWMLGVIVHFGLMALALPGLFARKLSGWTLVFYAELVSAVAAVLSLQIVGGLIGALIAFYILFQIRSQYK